MPLPSSGIIVVEKPSSITNTSITNPATTIINTVNSSLIHPSQQQEQTTQQQPQIHYYEYYDVNDNCQLSQQQQKQQQQHQEQKHSTIVVDGTLYHQQQQLQKPEQRQIQLEGSSVVIARRHHRSPLSVSTSSTTSPSLSTSSLSSLNKQNLHMQTLKTVPMPQTKQNFQQQQIIQHTSHSTNSNTANLQHHQLQQQQHQTQHVQQISLAASSSIHHQTQLHNQQQQKQQTQHQQPPQTTHMIHVSEEFLEQAANNHNTGNMMISTTGEIINQQQIFKIVGTDGTTGNMIIDTAASQNTANATTSKVLLSNLTVLSKQQAHAATASGQLIGGNNQQQPQAATGQTINFVNAKNLYATSSAAGVATAGGKQQKFTVTTANVGNYKSSGIKQTSNSQYVQQPNQKINMTGSGNRSMQMLTTTRVQTVVGSAGTNTNIGVITNNNTASAQTMVLQQPQKFITNSTGGKSTATLSSSGTGNIIKKSTSGTLRMNNTNNSAATTTKLINNLQTTQGVKTFITQTQSVQQQQHTPQNINQLTLQHHNTTKGNVKSKFAKQYNNAILNSAGAVAIATLPHQQLNNQNNFQPQHQQIQQPQTAYISHHKGGNSSGSGSTKINKINSKYAQSANLAAAAQLPPGTQLHQKTTPTAATIGSSTSGSSLLSDDIMMVNGTQMTDELSARILQSMSQKSFNNQRYHQQQQQQQQHVYQTKVSVTASSVSSPSTTLHTNNVNSNNNGNMLPPPISTQQQQSPHIPSNSSNILLSPREYTLYPTTSSSNISATTSGQQQQQQQVSPNHHYNNSANTSSAGGTSYSSNYMTITSSSTNLGNVNNLAPLVVTNTVNTVSSATIRQAQSAPNSRSQSMERKLHESSISRKSTEYYKVNNHSSLRVSQSNLTSSALTVQNGSMGVCTTSASNLMGLVSTTSTTSSSSPRPPSIQPPSALIMEPQAQVIHLQATKTLPGANNSSNDDDDDIIGEEVRPAPVETDDIRLRILHAVLFDHTYVNPMPLELPTSFAVQLPPTSNATNMATTSTSVFAGGAGHSQQWSLGGIGAVTAVGSGGAVAQQSYAIYGSQLSRLQDDDTYSAISSSSRLAVGDIDPGEETETAPEAELEDDSVTRCICDLTHDDGYMICCDKCCAWQHVDCMGIDRQNIPDEYLCELCQPRVVDKARARSLQLLKRKEQQLLLSAQAQAGVPSGTIGAAGSANGGSFIAGVSNLLPNDIVSNQQRLTSSGGTGLNVIGNISADSGALQLLSTNSSTMKKGKLLKKVKDNVTGKRSKKAEKLAAASAGGISSGKPPRKETKKNTKRKKTGTHEGGSTIGMTAAEKHAANLRQWIENYELAVTNHYSPELRARLHAITKQTSLLQCILNTENPILKEFSNGSLENHATTVPHAGGKILISNLDISPNSPICELRGKYMLTTQYKTQNTSMNMNSPPPNSYHMGSYKAHKTPGPFIFFYQLPGGEVASPPHIQSQTTTIQNPDGTYTTTAQPAQQSPPTFLKGPEICVDTRTYGNEARFVRRSCRPNAEIQHLFEKGTIHLFIVALTDIRASTEITIRHEPHDLLAVENKKSTMIIQPTSTPCACGLTKDCLFGPPLPQFTPAVKSNAGRKSLAHTGGSSNAKQRKANQQNINRNRSISSSASGDSNMGTTSTTTTTTAVVMGLNSPNNLGKIGGSGVASKSNNNNTLMPLTASCNSNLSNASSSSSTLTSVVLDSGICTSSSSPSVSIPSPTQHNMHSPVQQQMLQPQQQFLHTTNAQVNSNHLLPQQQQQQLVQSLPTPLILATSDISQQHQQQHQQLPALQQNSILIAQSTTTTIPPSTTKDIHATEQQIPQLQPQPQSQLQQQQQHTPLYSIQQHSIQQQLMSPKPISQSQTQLEQAQSNNVTSQSTDDRLETISPEASIAVVALQSLNASQSPVITTVNSSNVELKGMQFDQEQPTPPQQQIVLMTDHEPSATEKVQLVQGPKHYQTLPETNLVSASVPSPMSSSPQQIQTQQHKSPQKNNNSHSQQNNQSHQGRKTPAKHGGSRTTSLCEDNEHNQQQNTSDDNALQTAAPKSTSTPKEKPKLSREDRKMEAILRAIEKMERNQQRKQEQKHSKRQNSGSHNTTPTSPNKSFDGCENTGGSSTKRSNNHGTGRSKKKRKAGNKGGHGGNNNNQRKRRQSRMNSQESVEGCGTHDADAITSESDSGAAMHSPPIQTMASMNQTNYSNSIASNINNSTSRLSSDTISNNVDQAAGLLMAFANPPPSNNSTESTAEQHVTQSPHRSSSHYTTTSSPSSPTPPSQVSSACLLIEAAVGPLESNLNTSDNSGEIQNTEFKYPPPTKTKKHMMNNWLHQAEEESTSGNSETQTACTTGMTGGLDSLLQAAMSDLKQSQSQTETVANTEQPQNLSIAAQKVEEFIQQTEASSIGSPTPSTLPSSKHSFEYEQNHVQHQIGGYVDMAAPVVDLAAKTSLIGSSASILETDNNNKNFHLPLQVSTCSNNSSVKKRWLRQAISEESHEEFQQNFSMTPSPTAVPAVSIFVNSQQQTVAANLPATMPTHVPNGFTTPLKKRRLLLTGKDQADEKLTQNCGEILNTNTPSSPPPLVSQEQQQCENIQTMISSPLKQNQDSLNEIQNKDMIQNQTQHHRDASEDVDVDVEFDLNDAMQEQKQTQNEHTEEIKSNQLQDNIKYLKAEVDQEQDVDVTTSPKDEQLPLLEEQIKMKTVVKYEEDSLEPHQNESSSRSAPPEFNDQEDDVDILRSPSPGREMIKAEDNLVKIEPEDTSGTEDVKIDVEREEESMAADEDFITMPQLLKENKTKLDIATENLEIKKEVKLEILKDDHMPKIESHLTREDVIPESNMKLSLKTEEITTLLEDGEPKQKRQKLDKLEMTTTLTVCVKEQTMAECNKIDESMLKKEIKIKNEVLQSKQNQKLEVLPHSTTRNIKKDEIVLKKESPIRDKLSGVENPEVTSSTSPNLLTVKSVAADTTFADADAATPPPSTVTAAPIQRHKSLSDDDIQARLHNFHKENILFLQSRNKKSKSACSSANSQGTASTNLSFSNSNDNQKNRTTSSSSSSSSNYHNHHHHHRHDHDIKDKSDKTSSKHHHKSSSTTTSSGSSKKQKLHKRERTTSSSSSNSHKNSIASLISSSSSSSTSLSKNAVINSSTSSSSSSSSKKVKPLKKSSSGSSTSSNSSSTTISSSSNLILQNCYPSSSVGTVSTNAVPEKDKSLDKEKHQRQRTNSSSSNSNNNNGVSNIHTTPTTTIYPSSKKRQLNFELELTKDLHLLNNAISGGGSGGVKHKRAEVKVATDDHTHVSKKSKKESTTSSQKGDEPKNGTNKQFLKAEKQHDKRISVPTTNSLAKPLLTTPSANTTSALIEEPKPIPTIVTQPPVQTASSIRELPTLLHFNNVNSTVQQTPPTLSPVFATIPAQSQPLSTIVPPNIPSHLNSPTFQTSSIHSSHNYSQQQQHPPPSLPTPPPCGISSTIPTNQNVNSSNNLPFYNTIYGKLLDNPTSTPPSLAAPTNSLMPTTTPSSITGSTSAISAGGVLSEYLDTKLKSYSSLGGYVSHSALFGLNNMPSIKDAALSGVSTTAQTNSSITTVTTSTKDFSAEMPAPLAPPPSVSSITSCSNSVNTTPLKIHTKTASHDPRLNPHLSAPEPPPQPKRKLSINEYRKRMQQSSSSDSNGSSLTTTPTTPPISLEASSTIDATSTTTPIHKCTLNSPDRLTQSVDSQIQKEIMSSTSATVTSSCLDSLNSSNSSTSSNSLNDILLKSSSFVEEDSTKGQFNAAPTLLEKQQENLCARLKSLKEKQSLGAAFGVGSGNRSRFSSFSESIVSSDFCLRKDDDDVDIIRNRNISISSSIGGVDLLDNCLEEISSASTSMSSSREPSPERYTTNHQKVLTASATTTMTTTSAASQSNNGQTSSSSRHINCDKSDATSLVGLDRKKSVDIA
ncbi:hypothetical protein DOY81_005504 [Sarcophaga bullata]|nr:hypothetical protein DOY81_005504 [Sarcophaga bullata]